MLTVAPAERLLDLASEVNIPRATVIYCSQSMTGDQFARIKLALDLVKQPALFRFRAVAECWDHQRIVRELY